jgi:hypothetical protein
MNPQTNRRTKELGRYPACASDDWLSCGSILRQLGGGLPDRLIIAHLGNGSQSHRGQPEQLQQALTLSTPEEPYFVRMGLLSRGHRRFGDCQQAPHGVNVAKCDIKKSQRRIRGREIG